MTQGIYSIKNTDNGKIYIGKSSNIESRAGTHLYQLSSGCHPLSLMQKDYDNGDDFGYEIIEVVESTDGILDRERYWITHLQASNPTIGYNNESYRPGGLPRKPGKVDKRGGRREPGPGKKLGRPSLGNHKEPKKYLRTPVELPRTFPEQQAIQWYLSLDPKTRLEGIVKDFNLIVER